MATVILKALGALLGFLLMLGGLILFSYSLWWFVTRPASGAGGWASGLGHGFALLFMIVGGLALLIGLLLLWVSVRKKRAV